MDVQGRSSTVKETVISCVEAPRLKGISTGNFIEFKRLRDLYEKRIEKKGRQLNESIVPTSYRALLEDDDLKLFIAAGWVEWSPLDELTERQIQHCVEERCKREVTGEQLYLVDLSVRNVSMKMHIPEAEERVWSLTRDYCQAPRGAGFDDLVDSKPPIAINHMLKRLKPPQLYHRMRDIIIWRKDEKFEKENFNRFVREVARQSKKIQTELRLIPPQDKHENRVTSSSKRNTFHVTKREQAHREERATPQRQYADKADKDKQGTERKRESFEAPLCLNPTCRAAGKRHYINNCEIADKDTRSALLEEYRRNKKARLEDRKKDAGNVGQVTHIPTKPHSSMFKASFARGAISVDIMADQGSDANFMSAQLLKEIRPKLSNITTETLMPPQIYPGVTGEQCLTCRSTVKLDVFICIRHGTSLILRNIVWKVTKEDLKMPILGRRVLESLGCDNRKMLLAAQDKFGDNIVIEERLIEDGNEDEKDSTIAALYGESVFHQAGQTEDDGLCFQDAYVDLGDDPPDVIEKELQERLREAKENGCRATGQKH